MKEIAGKAVYKGVAKGPVVLLQDDISQVMRSRKEDAGTQIVRVDRAVEQSKEHDPQAA